MSAITEREEPKPLSAEDLFHFWSQHAEDFMHWQKKNFIARQAKQEDLEEHAKRLDLILGLTLHMYSVASRAMPGALRAISGRLRQLQDSRTLVHNPMSDEGADAVLRQAFPDEPQLAALLKAYDAFREASAEEADRLGDAYCAITVSNLASLPSNLTAR